MIANGTHIPVQACGAVPTAQPDPVLGTTELALQAALQAIDAYRAKERQLQRELEVLALAVTRLQQLENRDELTGLVNRRLLADRVEQAMARAARQDERVALLFLDLDGFKQVNDSFGHAAGDKVLQEVAARLTACMRTSDTACRYGGDEFVVLLSEFADVECLRGVGEKIRAQLTRPHVVDGHTIRISASIGHAIYPGDGNSYVDLVRASDRAMYREKARAKTDPSAASLTNGSIVLSRLVLPLGGQFAECAEASFQ